MSIHIGCKQSGRYTQHRHIRKIVSSISSSRISRCERFLDRCTSNEAADLINSALRQHPPLIHKDIHNRNINNRQSCNLDPLGRDLIAHIAEWCEDHSVVTLAKTSRILHAACHSVLNQRRDQPMQNSFRQLIDSAQGTLSAKEMRLNFRILDDHRKDIPDNQRQKLLVNMRNRRCLLCDAPCIRDNAVQPLERMAREGYVKLQHIDGEDAFLIIAVTPRSAKMSKTLLFLVWTFQKGNFDGLYVFNPHSIINPWIWYVFPNTAPNRKYWQMDDLVIGKRDFELHTEESLKLLVQLYEGKVVNTAVTLPVRQGVWWPDEWPLVRFDINFPGRAALALEEIWKATPAFRCGTLCKS